MVWPVVHVLLTQVSCSLLFWVKTMWVGGGKVNEVAECCVEGSGETAVLFGEAVSHTPDRQIDRQTDRHVIPCKGGLRKNIQQ